MEACPHALATWPGMDVSQEHLEEEGTNDPETAKNLETSMKSCFDPKMVWASRTERSNPQSRSWPACLHTSSG